jgi:anti-anti-sigma factor
MAATKAESRDGILVVKFVDPELSDEMRIREIGQELFGHLDGPDVQLMLLNFDGVSFMSSAMLGQLAMLTKRCMTSQVALKLCNLDESMREVLRIVRLDTLAEIVESEDRAVAEFRFAQQRGETVAGTGAVADLQSADDYRSAADGGDTAAQYRLGQCYEIGKGVQQDFAEAITWYRKAAEHGHAEAQNALANAYAYGVQVSQDYDQAVQWYAKAAEQGHADAQYAMGMNCNYGVGVDRDDARAERWYQLAAEQGHQKAREALDQLQQQPG